MTEIWFEEIPLKNLSMDTAFARGFEVWDQLPKAEDGLPSWPGIEFLLSVPLSLAPETMVLRIESSIDDARYIYWGSRLIWVSGQDMTGKRPFDIPSKELREYVEATMMTSIKEKRPCYILTEFTGANGLKIPEEILRLPFANAAANVDHLVTFTSVNDIREMRELLTNT